MTNTSIIRELENYFKISYKTFNNDYYNWERKKREQEGYNNANRFESSNAQKLLDILLELKPGEYKKKDLRKKLQINDTSQFSKILNNAIENLEAQGIKQFHLQTRSIIICDDQSGH